MTTLSSPEFVVQTPEQARLLLDLGYFDVLGEVMRCEASAGEVARAVGLSVKQAHHRLTRLVRADLVEVCGERRRGGRPVKLYRAVARGFQVPFGLTDSATMAELIGTLQRPFMTAYARAAAGEYGRTFGRGAEHDVFFRLDAQGQPSLYVAPSGRTEENLSGYGLFTQVNLKPEVLKELSRRLRELRAWVAEQESHDPGAEPCLLGLLLTPGRLEEG
ncbi:helix-turn-helix domain-containing protein [Deinococcus apachensis]|uniref:helix-turn-helix domain-containing protein n=1 Tax=Deinococcus apachensis TaxID=309886 RepID=UPI000375A405|nr:helix-turn-helix domain-containing protein [Deinococcus apachensis]